MTGGVMSKARIAVAAIGLLMVSGCAHEIQEVLAPLTGGSPSNATAAPRTSGPVVTEPNATPKPQVAPGTNAAEAKPGAAGIAGGEITLNFVDADVREIVRTLLGNILKVTYTIDPNVHGTATIQTAHPISREMALTILEGVLGQNGAAMTVADGVYRVIGNQAAQLSSNVVGPTEAGAGTKIVMLRYASAADLATVLEPFMTPGGKIVPDPSRNALLITGDAATRAAIEEVVRAFDVDILKGKSFALFPVNNDDPEKVAGDLTKVMMSGENGALANLVQVIPMERVNAVLVVSSQPRYIDDARRLFALVDRMGRETVRSWHVYYVHNGQSTDLEYVLQSAFTPDHVTSTGTSDTNRLGSMVPGLQISNMAGNANGGQTGGFGGGLTGSTGTGGAAPGMLLSQANQQAQGGGGNNQQQRPANAAAPPATESLSSTEKGKEKDSIRIIANRANNALLIYATPQEYERIDAMLDKIDILPLQVEIDATIAEVTLNDQLQYGVQFYLKNGSISGLLSQGAAGTASGLPLSVNFPAFVLEKANGAVEYTLSALQAVTTVRVLSAPQITVLDNETATLQVGDQVPYLTQSATDLVSSTPGTNTIVNSVAYQETGVIMQVIPRVNSGGLVTLDIAQEVSQPINTTTSSIGSPTFSDRVVKSRVVVQDGQTIGLAGLISDNDSRSNGGVPWIKDIPVLGTLVSNQDNQRMRTELLVLLTPHVNYDQREVRSLTEDLRHKLWRSGQVPQDLRNLPPSGSSEPNAPITNGF
jgi:general secretion pathway protein D